MHAKTHNHKKGNIKEVGPGTVTPCQSAALQLFAWSNKKKPPISSRWLIVPVSNASGASCLLNVTKKSAGCGPPAVPKLLSTPPNITNHHWCFNHWSPVSGPLCAAVIPHRLLPVCSPLLIPVLFTNELPGGATCPCQQSQRASAQLAQMKQLRMSLAWLLKQQQTLLYSSVVCF